MLRAGNTSTNTTRESGSRPARHKILDDNMAGAVVVDEIPAPAGPIFPCVTSWAGAAPKTPRAVVLWNLPCLTAAAHAVLADRLAAAALVRRAPLHVEGFDCAEAKRDVGHGAAHLALLGGMRAESKK